MKTVYNKFNKKCIWLAYLFGAALLAFEFVKLILKKAQVIWVALRTVVACAMKENSLESSIRELDRMMKVVYCE